MADIKQEIIDWFVNDYEYKDDFVEDGDTIYFYKAWEGFQDAIWGSGTVELASGTAKTLTRFGGEGKGDTYYVVFQIGEKIYRVDGYYSSWEGVNWDSAEPYEVKPKEVTIIRYEKA